MRQRIFTRLSRNIHSGNNKEYWNDVSKKLERLEEKVSEFKPRVSIDSYGPGIFSISAGIFGGLWLADTFNVNPFKERKNHSERDPREF